MKPPIPTQNFQPSPYSPTQHSITILTSLQTVEDTPLLTMTQI